MQKNSEGIVINTNDEEFQRYKLERLRVVKQKSLEDRIEKIEQQLTALVNEFSELKNRIR